MATELLPAFTLLITDPAHFTQDAGAEPADVFRKARTTRTRITGVLRVLTGEFLPLRRHFWRDDDGELRHTYASPQTLTFRAQPPRPEEADPVWHHYTPC